MCDVYPIQTGRRPRGVMSVAVSWSRRIPHVMETESTHNASKYPAEVFVSCTVNGVKYAIEVIRKNQFSVCSR